MAKPIHPAAVHFPIAFLLLAYGLDILSVAYPHLPASVTGYLPSSPSDFPKASYYLLSLGLITAVPAVITGGAEAIKMISKSGLYEADGKTIRTKVKATVAHALSADLVIAGSAYIWSQRRAALTGTLAGKLDTAAAYQPEQWMVIAEAVLVVLLSVAGNIGGNLTYTFGVGFSSASSGGAKKKQ